MAGKKMLIVEDEDAISMALEDDFRYEGFDVVVAADGKSGLEVALEGSFDVILLDVMLPQMDGIAVCNELRRRGHDVPIIMLTAKSQEIDKVLGLEIGADDYVTKPFSPRELQARVKAVMRRNEAHGSQNRKTRFGDILVDSDGHLVFKGDSEVKLTAREFSLLKFLIANMSRVLSRDDILDAVWNEDVIVEPRTVDTHIANLRRKLEDDPANPRWIIGVRGVGYKLVTD